MQRVNPKSSRVKEKSEIRFLRLGSCALERESEKEFSPYYFACPTCEAPRLHRCASANGRDSRMIHQERQELAAGQYREAFRSRAALDSGEFRQPGFVCRGLA